MKNISMKVSIKLLPANGGDSIIVRYKGKNDIGNVALACCCCVDALKCANGRKCTWCADIAGSL